MTARTLQPREVVVRYVRSDPFLNPGLALQARELLGFTERAALARQRSPTASRDYLAAHALARSTLAELTGCEAERIRLRRTTRGKPEVAWPTEGRQIRLSLSHADGVALCAVAKRCEVGADVESGRNLGRDPLGVAELACTRGERSELHSLPDSLRASRLLYLWTRKEAIAKAAGLGCSLPFDRIGVEGADNGPADQQFAVQGRQGVLCGLIRTVQLTRYHLASIAVLGGPGRRFAVRFEEALPLATPSRPVRFRIISSHVMR